eukprot:scaffold16111_cov172-Amphora_coffeaeformis.AAC.5
MQETFDQLVRLNSAGAAKMASGDYEAGLAAFAYGLTITIRSSSPEFTHKKNPSDWKLASTQSFAHDASTKLCDVFDRCFVVSTPIDTSEKGIPHMRQNKHLLTAILYYNTALAFHLAGSRSAEHQRYNFGQAWAFYRRTLGVVQRMNPSQDVAKISLATVNNIASLALEELDFECYGICRKKISAMTAAMTSDFYFDFFVGNFVTTEAIHKHPASAA